MPPLLLLHVLAGLTGVMAGVAALLLRKGSAPHRHLGILFAVAMLAMGLSGAYRAAFVHWQPVNVIAGLFTAYLVASGWLAARRSVVRLDPLTLAVTLAGSALALGSLAFAAITWHATPGADAAIGALAFGGLTVLGVGGDVRLVTRGPLVGIPRVRRHLWRVGLALLLATVSLFLGTPNRILPAVIAGTPLQWLPVGLVIGLLLLGRWRTRVRGARTPGRLVLPGAR